MNATYQGSLTRSSMARGYWLITTCKDAQRALCRDPAGSGTSGATDHGGRPGSPQVAAGKSSLAIRRSSSSGLLDLCPVR